MTKRRAKAEPDIGEAAGDAGAPAAGGSGARNTRRCVATGVRGDPATMIRFALSPEGVVTPDVAGVLPGRGAWLAATPEAFARAMKKNAFARGYKRPVTVPPDLPALVERLLADRCLHRLGLARRAGEAHLGYERTREAVLSGAVAAVLEASDAGADGRHKIAALMKASESDAALVRLFARGELGLAFGRENVVHAALARGGSARAFLGDAARLAGIRGVSDAFTPAFVVEQRSETGPTGERI